LWCTGRLLLTGVQFGCQDCLEPSSAACPHYIIIKNYYGSIFVSRCSSYYTHIRLSEIFPMFLDFSRGEIRYVWISPGGKCAPVAFLLARNSHVLHFSRGESRMCCISPGEKSHAVWSCLAGHDNSEVFGFLPGKNPICVDFSRGEMRTCCISPGEKV
jgi:hypothetical protein